jgi:hypothetical protein
VEEEKETSSKGGYGQDQARSQVALERKYLLNLVKEQTSKEIQIGKQLTIQGAL